MILSTQASGFSTLDVNRGVSQVIRSDQPPCGSEAVDQLTRALCDEDQKAICENIKNNNTNLIPQISLEVNQQANLDHLAKQASSIELLLIKGEKTEAKKQLHGLAQTYLKIILSLQANLDQKFQALGVSAQDIETRILLLRDAAIRRVSQYPQFANTPAEATIAQLRFITPWSLSKTSDEEMLDYYGICGPNGLVVNATFDEDHSLMICPGFFASMLQKGGNPDLMDFVVSHEISHSVDFLASPKGSASPFSKSYLGYLRCIDKRDQIEFEDPRSFLTLKTKLEARQKSCQHLLSLRSPPPHDEIAVLKRELDQSKAEASDLEGILSIFELVQDAHLSSAVVAHAKELAADLLGSDFLADQLQNIPKPRQAEYVGSNLSVFCANTDSNPADSAVESRLESDCAQVKPALSDSEKLELESGDDGVHPSNAYRIHALMHNPRIRKELGCAPLPVDDPHPACSLSSK